MRQQRQLRGRRCECELTLSRHHPERYIHQHVLRISRRSGAQVSLAFIAKQPLGRSSRGSTVLFWRVGIGVALIEIAREAVRAIEKEIPNVA
jgi:hypothetical protein